MTWILFFAIPLPMAAWAFVGSLRFRPRILGLIVRAVAGGGWGRAALVGAGLQLVCLVAFAGTAYGGVYLSRNEPHAWPTLVLTLIMGIVCCPFFPAFAPRLGPADAYGPLRRDLEKAGATTTQARAVAWAAGPPGFVGTMASLILPLMSVAATIT